MIPAGGAGSRLWPRSRRDQPKHLLPLSGTGKPLLRETYERILPLAEEVFVLTEARQLGAIRELLPELDDRHLIVEPAARGTTNAIGLAAMTLLARDPEAVMLSLAADHVIRGAAGYRAAVRRAERIATLSGEMVLVGLVPRYPATGFGYIRAGAEVAVGRFTAREVLEFVEKPDAARALSYVESGDYFWNLAMFCFRVDTFVSELARHGPRHHAGLKRVLEARRRGDEASAGRAYGRLPVQAVDYTVMERSRRRLMIAADFGWVDVGSWAELADLLSQDQHGNVVEGDPILIDTHDSFISVPDKLVAVIGLNDVVIVDTPDALLVCPKSRSQEVKKVVEALSRSRKIQYL